MFNTGIDPLLVTDAHPGGFFDVKFIYYFGVSTFIFRGVYTDVSNMRIYKMQVNSYNQISFGTIKRIEKDKDQILFLINKDKFSHALPNNQGDPITDIYMATHKKPLQYPGPINDLAKKLNC